MDGLLLKQQTPYLKLATEEDIPPIFNLAKQFRDESPYSHLTHDDELLLENIYKIVQGDRNEFIVICIVDQSDQILGILAGSLTQTLFSQDRLAVELIWYVLPEHRTAYSLQLVRAFEYWAKKVGASVCSFSSLDNSSEKVLDRYYRIKGYRKAETTYIKDI